ncbi:MAG: hypothetical protein QXR73_01870 [Candidatus Micrarchaeaceae archaeon]
MVYIEAKAPGKVLWLGGYSVLEPGNIGFVTTINAYVTASLKPIKSREVKIDAPDLGVSLSGNLDNDNHVKTTAPKELVLALTATNIALGYLTALGQNVKGFEITTKNDSAFEYRVGNNTGDKRVTKSGMGSSSAVTVAITSAILKAFGGELYSIDAVHKLSQLSHSLATGKVGSGFDIAAATYGSIKYSRYNPDLLKNFPQDYSPADIKNLIEYKWDYKAEKLNLPDMFSTSMANFVGDAAITTEMVGSVSGFKKENPESYNQIIKAMNLHAENSLQALENINKGIEVDYNTRKFKDEFIMNRKYSKQLGVKSKVNIEDDEATKLIDESESNGAFVAKLPGAGGRDSIVALSLNDSSAKNLKGFWASKNNLQLLELSMQNGGVSVADSKNKTTRFRAKI